MVTDFTIDTSIITVSIGEDLTEFQGGAHSGFTSSRPNVFQRLHRGSLWQDRPTTVLVRA